MGRRNPFLAAAPILALNSKTFALFSSALNLPEKQAHVNQGKIIPYLGQKLVLGAFTISKNSVIDVSPHRGV